MQNKASLKLQAAACPPSHDYRIAGNRPTVKGAEGAAKPFTLDGRAVFCYVPLLRHPVRVIDRKLGVDHRPVLSPARPLFCDVQHGQIQHLEQAVIFHFRNGSEKRTKWEYESRSKSWTPEMKIKAAADAKRRKHG